jgi:Cu(I)/Ag(I) efflux system membrane fusion protein
MSSKQAERPRTRAAGLALQITLVRLRFLLVLLAALAVVGTWPVLRAWWDKLTRPSRPPEGAVSTDTEYWCPMCPGVVSAWPGKCPVCSMALVRRQKGEAVPLPDGVLARMQLAPYRVQLAGVKTVPLEYLSLARVVVLTGTTVAPEVGAETARTRVKAEAFEPDLVFIAEGQSAAVTSDLVPGRTLSARVRKIGPAVDPQTRTASVWLEVEDAPDGLRPGATVTVRVEAPAVAQEWCQRAVSQEWQRRTAAGVVVGSLLRPAAVPDACAAAALVQMAAPQALLRRGLVLAVPESAVLDHGAHKVAYVETMPGMFDGVAVTVGPRCGDYYPVLSGLEAGQRVAAAGAFLLDAEARLNPALAAAYFGASRTSTPLAPPTQMAPPTSSDQELIALQKICPVTGEPLDSMGGPVRVEVAGRVVFICCEGCESRLRKNPDKYLSKLPKKQP